MVTVRWDMVFLLSAEAGSPRSRRLCLGWPLAGALPAQGAVVDAG
jgi:hypothetical protein